ncbi:uncharacterized protein PADG_04624 [Paracoccidioides brasiliensis Pb18]|uniref:Uncharacterized protein n=1 Tax=Paracoccidioides brasiliensis (strain Pb18) TaxID=502780 RepID=C1GCA2_PARBD|nr:uncharacterized protein PADG_04624 [Paracoccidioides brasiliensis Pb18]EEH48545.2 hypothetical protein PADG_04624 [Paracoccidioides brasiliensis Pb18]
MVAFLDILKQLHPLRRWLQKKTIAKLLQTNTRCNVVKPLLAVNPAVTHSKYTSDPSPAEAASQDRKTDTGNNLGYRTKLSTSSCSSSSSSSGGGGGSAAFKSW